MLLGLDERSLRKGFSGVYQFYRPLSYSSIPSTKQNSAYELTQLFGLVIHPIRAIDHTLSVPAILV
jgi:hypothetical protein